jgi:cation transport regulator
MPYRSITELPEGVQHVLPKHAQDIYKEAFNHAYEEYKDPDNRRGHADREEVSHKIAWAAVKHKYEKGDDSKWHPKK